MASLFNPSNTDSTQSMFGETGYEPTTNFGLGAPKQTTPTTHTTTAPVTTTTGPSFDEETAMKKKQVLDDYYGVEVDLKELGKGKDPTGYQLSEKKDALDTFKGTVMGGLIGLLMSGGNPAAMLMMAGGVFINKQNFNYRRDQAEQLLSKGYRSEFVEQWLQTGDDRFLAEGKKTVVGSFETTDEKTGELFNVDVYSDGTQGTARKKQEVKWSPTVTLKDGSKVQFKVKADGAFDNSAFRVIDQQTDADALKQREAELQLQAKYREPKTVQTGWVDHKLDPNDPTRVIQRKVDANGNFIMNGDKFIERDVLGSSAQQKLTQRSRADEKQYTELQQTAERLTDEAANAEFLADEIENSKQWRTGVFGKWTESFNDLVGSQDAVSALKKAYLDRKNKEVINGLPPGAASDNDIRIFMSGFPSENANKETLVSWLRGKAKAQRLAAENADRKLDWMDQNGSLSKKDKDGNTFQKAQRSATPATPAPKEEVKTEPTTPSNLGKRLGLAPAGWEEGSVKKNGSRTVTVYQGYVYEMK